MSTKAELAASVAALQQQNATAGAQLTALASMVDGLPVSSGDDAADLAQLADKLSSLLETARAMKLAIGDSSTTPEQKLFILEQALTSAITEAETP